MTLDDTAALVDTLLRTASGNVALADGLGLQTRFWVDLHDLPLARLTRCCGPELDMEFVQDEAGWTARVDAMRASLRDGWAPPPLIVQFRSGVLSVRDGNHRLAALLAEGRASHAAFVWFDTPEERASFERTNPPG